MNELAPAAAVFGRPHVRIDGRAKVTGRALYPSDEVVPNPAYAFLLTSAIAKGRIRHFDLEEARALEGVLDILTYENVGDEAKPPKQQAGGGTTTTLQSDRVWHDGQIIGVIVAETYEIAREAAYRVHVHYEKEQPAATFGSDGAEEEVRKPGEHEDFRVGDADGVFAAAEIRIDASYGTPTQHHNAIELFTTTCAWNDSELTIWEPSQFVYGLRATVAEQIGLPPERVHVISKFVGGAFGSKGGATARTAWIAIAARRLNRPVKLVPTRDQGFTIATYRAETRHHIQLGATREGRLTAFRHEGWEVTSRPSTYNVSGTADHGPHVWLPEHPDQGQHRPRGSEHAGFHEGSAGYTLHVPAGIGDGRTCRGAWDGPDRTAPAQRYADGSGHRPSFLEPSPHGLFRCRRRALRLEGSQRRAPIHEGRRLADRLGLRQRRLSLQYCKLRRTRDAARRR